MLEGIISSLRISLWTIYLVSSSANLLHLVVLQRMKSFIKKPFGILVISITLADLTSDLTGFFRTAISHKFLVYSNYSDISVFLVNLSDFGGMVRYYILALASIEKYLAICKPYQYESHVLIKRIKMWCSLAWIIPLLEVSFRDLIFFRSVRLDNIIGSQNYDDPLALALLSFFIFLPLASCVICQGKVIKEIRRMRNIPSVISSGDRLLKSASKYLIVITIVLLVLLFPPMLFLVLLMFHVFTSPISVMMLALGSFSAIYGFVNIIAFAALSTSYRFTFKRSWLCLLSLRKNRIGREEIRTHSM